MKKDTRHLVINLLDGMVHCYHCGRTEPYNEKMPLPLDVALALMRHHVKVHQNCKPSPEGAALEAADKKAWDEFVEKNPYECPDCGSRSESEERHKFCSWRKRKPVPEVSKEEGDDGSLKYKKRCNKCGFRFSSPNKGIECCKWGGCNGTAEECP